MRRRRADGLFDGTDVGQHRADDLDRIMRERARG